MLPVASGAGAMLVDSDGNEYLDAVGGMWCTNIGLGRHEMADAVASRFGSWRTPTRSPT